MDGGCAPAYGWRPLDKPLFPSHEMPLPTRFSGALLPIAALLGSIVSLAVGTSFAKHLFPLVGAQGTTAIRVGFSALILIAVWRPWRHPLSWRQARRIVLYGAAMGSMNLMFYMALRTLPFGIAVAIEFIGPLGLALVSSRRALDFVWIAFAVTGLLLLLPFGENATHLDPVGLAYILGAASCWVLYIIFGQRTGSGHGGQATALGMTVAAIIAFPFGISHAGSALFDPALLVSGLAVAVLSSAIPYSLEMVALRGLPKQSFGVLVSLEPAASALAALVILGEVLTALQWLAIGCIIVASAGTAMGVGRKRAEESSRVEAEGSLSPTP